MQCSVCNCDFDPDEEGAAGTIGLMPVGFCQTCNAGIVDYVFQVYGQDEEDRMGDGVVIVPREFFLSMMDDDVLVLDFFGIDDGRTIN